MNQYELATKKHALYKQHHGRWQFLYDSYVGGEDYRKKGYLTRYQQETNDDYNARLQETPYDNQVMSIVSTYNSFLFRTIPTRELNSIERLPETEQFLRDADLEGRSFDLFMKEASTWSNVFGHCWIMVSKPNIGAQTRADEIANQVRPYVSILTPLTVIDWDYERTLNGAYELTYLKYLEDVNGDIETYREWTPDLIRTLVVDTDREEVNEIKDEPNQLGKIPAVICYSDRSIVRGIGVSSISDVADQCRYIYNALSEAAQSIRLDSHPSLVASAETVIGTGAGAVITMPTDIDPGFKPYVLDFNGASIDSILRVIERAEKSIEGMTHTGGVRSNQTQAMSGVALETEFQLLNVKLSGIANNLVLAEEGIWRLFCLYQNQPYDVDVQYPDSFSIRDSQNEIKQLQIAAATATSPAVKELIDREVLRWMEIPDEDQPVIRSGAQIAPASET